MASRTDRLAMMTALAREVRAGIKEATPERKFGRLRESFRFIVTGNGVTIYSIYYWARFANDGRRAINLQNRVMMFFLDPDDDPRVTEDYPRKRGQRKLTRQELKEARENSSLIVTRSVAGASPMKFIEKGVGLARKKVPAEVLDRIRGDVRSFIKRRRDKVTVRF